MNSEKPTSLFWRMLYKLKDHSGKILWVPMLASLLTFAANIMLDIADDGMIDEQEFHRLLQGASSTEMIILAVVMALLKIRKP